MLTGYTRGGTADGGPEEEKLYGNMAVVINILKGQVERQHRFARVMFPDLKSQRGGSV